MRGLAGALVVAAALLILGATPSLAIQGGGPPPTGDLDAVGRLTAVRQVPGGEVGERCGAVLVAPAWALTAGHCLTSQVGAFAPSDVAVTFASTRADGAGGVRATVAEIMRGTEDIALLRLTRDVPVAPAPLADAAPAAGDPVLALGWGSGTGAAPLEAADMRVERVGGPTLVTVPDMGAAHPGSAYHGDSGGPLLVRRRGGGYLLAGIARSAIDGGAANAWVRTDGATATSAWIADHLPAAPVPAAPVRVIPTAVKVDGLDW